MRIIDRFMSCYSAYVSFACFWYGMGQMVMVLISQITYRNVLTKVDYWLAVCLVVAWSFTFYYTYRFADLRAARKYNAYGKEMFQRTEQAMRELEHDKDFREWVERHDDEGFKKWIKKQIKFK